MSAPKKRVRPVLRHVKDADGKHVGSTYAETEQDAIDRIAKHTKRPAKSLRAYEPPPSIPQKK